MKTPDPTEESRWRENVYRDLAPVDELFSPLAKGSAGWRIPVEGQLISYTYFRPTDVAFEIWLGGDRDLTVTIQRDFTLDGDASSLILDPRTTQKSDLAPLLEIASLRVAKFFVTQSGRLDIEFDDGHHLIADAAPDGRAWRLGWPFEEPIQVASRTGGGIDIAPGRDHPPDDRDGEEAMLVWPDDEADMLVTGAVAADPGTVNEIATCASSIELILSRPGRTFQITMEGRVEINSPIGGHWQGNAAYTNAERSDLGPLLALFGAAATECRLDHTKGLGVDFEDRRTLTVHPEGSSRSRPAES